MRQLALLAFVTLLAACGFHLRGQGPGALFPYPTVFVSGNGPVAAQLRSDLQLMKEVQLLSAANPAAAQIRIDAENTDRKILSVNNAGRVSEYRLYYTVSYRVDQPGGDALIPGSTLQLFRSYSHDENNTLGKEAEAQLLLNDLRQDAARQILRRTGAAFKQRTQRAASEPTPSQGPLLNAN
ncbi:LPS assembly lipoprotein LptE [Chitiniphilus purpureus]|uniref:LPS-assembly lipoprotein LptE n=1 Tax=Chitiniphilus purpureus TaxID=2981137 RepID=A0ABY6DMD3_9NEIS|nr:LPS assembly lipoprotein LptE [Chitiniphilus sp. CD1]UXY15532.1 LPS assembly lipoprotein LptE [Chitiniphilus sp. CD1]